jgi:outer membrane immunogenic protein
MHMPNLMRRAILLSLLLHLLWLNASKASAQTLERLEAGGNYNYVRANAPPGGCGCFSMNGGAGWFAYNFTPGLAGVGEVGSAHGSNIDGTTGSLTVTSYLFGPRLSWHRRHGITPFSQILLGATHASGYLTPRSSGLAGSANSFAMAAGGGLDISLSRSWIFRALQADYYLTRFDNAVNNHQNNLRIGSGIIFRF